MWSGVIEPGCREDVVIFPFVLMCKLFSATGLIDLPFGGESEFVRGVRVVNWRWLVPDIVAAAVRGALKTEEAVLDELAEPTPLRRSPGNWSASSCVRVLLASLVKVSCFAVEYDI